MSTCLLPTTTETKRGTVRLYGLVTLPSFLVGAVAPVAEAQPPSRIGAALAQTGGATALGRNQLRGPSSSSST